jgi:aspartyl-tRNA synthetase
MMLLGQESIRDVILFPPWEIHMAPQFIEKQTLGF